MKQTQNNTVKPGDTVHIKVGDKCPACDWKIKATFSGSFICDTKKARYAHSYRYDTETKTVRMTIPQYR